MGDLNFMCFIGLFTYINLLSGSSIHSKQISTEFQLLKSYFLLIKDLTEVNFPLSSALHPFLL